jgi:hypothetical protein
MSVIETIESPKISLPEMYDILYQMMFYNRSSGYIAHDLTGTLCFFDSEPSFGGAYITRAQIIKFVQEESRIK